MSCDIMKGTQAKNYETYVQTTLKCALNPAISRQLSILSTFSDIVKINFDVLEKCFFVL